jgi:hypothetical protein
MGRKIFMDRQLAIRPLGLRHNGQNIGNEGFILIAELPIYPVAPCTENTFSNRKFELTDLLILHIGHCIIAFYLIAVSKLPSNPKIFNPECVCWTS